MKSQIFKSSGLSMTFIVSFSILTIMLLHSCDEKISDPPAIKLGVEQVSNIPGATITNTLRLDASDGLQSLAILRNGIVQNTVAYNGEKRADYVFIYVVEQLTTGSVITFGFQITDKRNRTSDVKTMTLRIASKEIVEVSGNITGSVTWVKSKIYRLNGFVRVQNGAKLTIEPGTLIIGSRVTKGTLIIQMGGQIFANGTQQEPIVLTSERAPGLREPGDWGGLVICGRARNNVTVATGQPVELEGGYGAFHGGTDDNDNSGILRYVRIEYAGIPINPNEEINSLTLGSVGRGTVIEYVMTSYGLDDAFEWFGGSVDAKYLIAYRNIDDDWDVDMGYSGRVQFGLSIKGASLADQSGSNAFEVDNNGVGSAAEPFTSAVFANITNIGPKKNRETAISLQFQHAAQLRRNSRISIYNSVMTGYPWGLYIDDDRPGSGQAALDGHLQIRNLVLAGVDHWGGNGYGSAGTIYTGAPSNGAQHPNLPRGVALRSHANFPGGQSAYETWYNTGSFNNKLIGHWGETGLEGSLFDLGTPKVTLPLSSNILNAAKWDNTPKADNFFLKVTYIGAFGTTDWTKDWAEWNCHSVRYY